jgi:hypothetical protein
VLIVMDQYTRRIIGFGIQAGVVNGMALCRMFQEAIRDAGGPKYLSSDHDPLYRFHQWQANLRILDVTEIKTVPYVPLSHPFIERLIGTIRRECLDRLLFWTGADLEGKLTAFKGYYNEYRSHSGLNGKTPVEGGHAKSIDFKIVCMETALSRSVSDANSRVNTNSPVTGTPIVFLRNQSPMPCQQSFRSDDGGDLRQNVTSKALRLCGKPPSLVVRKSESTITDLLPQSTIFLYEVLDHLLLPLIQPAGN